LPIIAGAAGSTNFSLHSELSDLDRRQFRSLGQYLFEKLQGTLVAGLTEPEHCLLSNRRFGMSPRDLYQKGYGFVLGSLAYRENRLFLHLGVVIGLFDHIAEHLEAALAGSLSEPEQGLLSELSVGIAFCNLNKEIQSLVCVAG
jgi:hypothetical protein